MAVSALAALGALSRAGWVFNYPRDDRGEVIAGYAVRMWPGGWWDGLILHSEDRCEAMRVDPSDVLTWQREGTVVDVVAALTGLPAPSGLTSTTS